MQKSEGYAVFMKLVATGRYINYTSLKTPVTEEMAESLAEHLRRNQTSSMIVKLPSGEIVKELAA